MTKYIRQAVGFINNLAIKLLNPSAIFEDNIIELSSNQSKKLLPEIVGDQFDEPGYLKANPDVAVAICLGQIGSALEHYEMYGKNERREFDKKRGGLEYVFKLKPIKPQYNRSFLEVSMPSGFFVLNDILVFGKSRLIFDVNRGLVFSDISEGEQLYYLMSKYLFHDELFGVVEYDVEDASLTLSKAAVFLKDISINPKISLEGQWISLLHHGSENWMHWISEILPRLFFSDALLDGNVGIIVDTDLPDNMYQSIKGSISSAHNIVRVSRHNFVHVTKLLIPETSSYTLMWERSQRQSGEWRFDESALLKMREKLISKVQSGSNSNSWLIYSQRKSNFRHIQNENDLKLALNNLGFFTVDTGSLSFFEQIEVFKYCRVFVTQAGAALANIAFMSAGSVAVVLALDSEYVHYEYFEQYASIFDVSIIYIKCKSYSNENYSPGTAGSISHPTNQDMICDVNLVLSTVMDCCKKLNIIL